MCLILIISLSWSEICLDFFTHNRSTNHKSPCHFSHPSLTPYSFRISSNRSLDQTDTLPAAVRERRSEKEHGNRSRYTCSKRHHWKLDLYQTIASPTPLFQFFFLNLCVKWRECIRLWKRLFLLLDVFAQWTQSMWLKDTSTSVTLSTSEETRAYLIKKLKVFSALDSLIN